MTDRAGSVFGSLDTSARAPFNRASMIRQVAGEPVNALVYQRALVMDVAHPSVAAAVADHSRFRQQPVRRLWATSDTGLRLIFGEGSVPMAAAQQIYRFHDHINGIDAETDTSYTAHDAILLRWVWATLVDTCELAFNRWVRPLGTGEGEDFYRDMRAFARFFGIPDRLLPPDRAAFRAYLDGVLAGDDLGSTANSRSLARDILWFHRWYTPPPVSRALRVFAIGTLDPRLAGRLDLQLGPADQRLFDRLDGLLARHYARLPDARIRLPYGYLALRRAH